MESSTATIEAGVTAAHRRQLRGILLYLNRQHQDRGRFTRPCQRYGKKKRLTDIYNVKQSKCLTWELLRSAMRPLGTGTTEPWAPRSSRFATLTPNCTALLTRQTFPNYNLFATPTTQPLLQKTTLNDSICISTHAHKARTSFYFQQKTNKNM